MLARAGGPSISASTGDDLQRAEGREFAELKAWLEGYTGVVDVLDDLRLGKPEITFRVNEEGLILGLRAQGHRRSAPRRLLRPPPSTRSRWIPRPIEIDARLAAIDRDDVATLDNFVVVTPSGALAPLSSVATIERDRGFARINRVQKRRTVTVQGDVDNRFANANEVVSDTMTRFVPGLLERYPGVSLGLEGQNAEASKTQASMIAGFALGHRRRLPRPQLPVPELCGAGGRDDA